MIENAWYQRIKTTILYLYEFSLEDFTLLDASAGYYVAKVAQTPIAVHVVNDLFQLLLQLDTEIRIADSLWKIAEEVQQSSLDWSLCRMAHAKPQQ